MFALQGERLKDHMVCFNLWDINQRIAALIAPEDVRQSRFANLTLELMPEDTCIMSRHLSILFGLEPALDTIVVNELNTATALADLQQWVFLIELGVPAETAVGGAVTVFWHNFLTMIGGLGRWGRWAFTIILIFGLIRLVSLLDLWQLLGFLLPTILTFNIDFKLRLLILWLIDV
jgi:hypothetical protein